MKISEEVAGAATFFATEGATAWFGMIGAAMLFFAMPPVDKDGKFNRSEFVTRLAVAGIFSIFFGDMLAAALQHFVPWLEPLKNRSAVDLLAGAPGWWISRAAALWLHRRQNKDLGQIAEEIKGSKE